MLPLFAASLAGETLAGGTVARLERTLPGEGEAQSGAYDSFNLILVVGLAIVIAVLARYLAGKGRRK